MMLQKGRREILTEPLLAVSRSLLANHSIFAWAVVSFGNLMRTKNRSVISKDADRREGESNR